MYIPPWILQLQIKSAAFSIFLFSFFLIVFSVIHELSALFGFLLRKKAIDTIMNVIMVMMMRMMVMVKGLIEMDLLRVQ